MIPLEDRPVFNSLVDLVLPYMEAKHYAIVENPFILARLQRIEASGVEVSIGQPEFPKADCLLIWDHLNRDFDIELWAIEAIQHYDLICFNCMDAATSEWYARLFKRLGYQPHVRMTNRIKEISWGCKVFQRMGTREIKPLVSVIVPVKNTQPYIEEALRSILNQSYTNLELIVVNDSSQDDSMAIAREVLREDTSRFHVILDNPLSGAAGARQTGINFAVGDFIVCFDSDDVMCVDYIEQALLVFDDQTDFAFPRQWWSLEHTKWEELGPLKNIARDAELRFRFFEPGFRGVVSKIGSATLVMNTSNYKFGSQIGSCMIISTVCRFSAKQRFDSTNPRLQDWDMHLDLIRRQKRGQGFFAAPFIRVRSDGITGSNTRNEYASIRMKIRHKFSFTPPPRLFVIPLDSRSNFNTSLASTLLRGVNLANCIDGAVIGDLDQLKVQWRQFDCFYFVCSPQPTILGWVEFLRSQGKQVLFDVCVAHWNRDFLFPHFTNEDRLEILRALKPHVHFVFATQGIREECESLIGTCEATVIDDSVNSYVGGILKTDYSLTRKICWTGDPGNIPVLLYYTPQLRQIMDKHDLTLRLISSSANFRIPLKWEWKKWSWKTEREDIIECDICLIPRLSFSSYRFKGRGKKALASVLGMPIVEMEEQNGWEQELDNLILSGSQRQSNGFCNLFTALQSYIPQLVSLELQRILHV